MFSSGFRIKSGLGEPENCLGAVDAFFTRINPENQKHRRFHIYHTFYLVVLNG
jgi:hypothetical protein